MEMIPEKTLVREEEEEDLEDQMDDYNQKRLNTV